MDSIVPTMALIGECISDIYLAIELLQDLEDGISVLRLLVAGIFMFAGLATILQLGAFWYAYKKNEHDRRKATKGIILGAILTDWADSWYLLAVGNRLDSGTVVAILLPVLLPAVEIGLTVTCKPDHLVSHTLFAQGMFSPTLIVSHAFYFVMFYTDNSLSIAGLHNDTTVNEVSPVLTFALIIAILGLGFCYYCYVGLVTNDAWENFDFTSWKRKITLQGWFTCVYKKTTRRACDGLMQFLHFLLLTVVALAPIFLSFAVLAIAEEGPSILFLVVLLLRGIVVGFYIVFQIGDRNVICSTDARKLCGFYR